MLEIVSINVYCIQLICELYGALMCALQHNPFGKPFRTTVLSLLENEQIYIISLIHLQVINSTKTFQKEK